MTFLNYIYPALWFLTFLLTQGFFSGSEIALVASDQKKLRQMAIDGHKGASLAVNLLNSPNRFFAVTLLGTALSVSANTVLTTAWMVGHWKYGEWLAILLLPPFILILGEIIPKMVFQQQAQQLAPRAAYGITLASFVLFPLVWTFSRISKLMVSTSSKAEAPHVTREELKLILRMDESEVELDKAERGLIHKMFSFSEKNVSRVMIPLVKVSAVSEEAPLSDAVARFRDTGFGRLPVYRRRIDNVIGILYAFDLIGAVDNEQPVKNFLRAPYYVPETKQVSELLIELQREGKTIAVVVDEYGGTIGIVTVEDLLEEVMGEMADEFDQESPPFHQKGPNHFAIKGRMEINQINEQLRLGIPKGDYETLAGFILKRLGFIPQAGYSFTFGSLQFNITKADPKSIEEVDVLLKRKGPKK